MRSGHVVLAPSCYRSEPAHRVNLVAMLIRPSLRCAATLVVTMVIALAVSSVDAQQGAPAAPMLSSTAPVTPTISMCALSDGNTLPDADLCLSEWLPASGFMPREQSASDALYVLVDQRIKASDLAGAEKILGCAAVQIDGEKDWRGRYEVIRRYGIVDYKQEKIARALGRFQCALSIAQSHDDRPAIAKQLKNIGSGLRRIGDYDAALTALIRSLQIQRAEHDPAIGPVLNNIADVYRESERFVEAERYYREALDIFRRENNVVESMHVYDSLSELAFDRGDIAAATTLLQAALQSLSSEDNRSYRLNVYAGLMRAAMLRGDLEQAHRYSSEGLALATQYNLPIPPDLHLQTARADRLSGRSDVAMARLRAALAAQPEGNAPRAALLNELATTLGAVGRNTEALVLLRQAHALELHDVREQSSQRLGWLQERFDAAQRERTISALREQNRHRTLMLWLTAVSALAALMMLSMVFLRRQQHARLIEAASKARYEEMLTRYRREAEALAEDRHALQTLLDSREDAMCLLDTDGEVRAANRGAAALLGVDQQTLAGVQLAERLIDADAVVLKAALENMEDMQSQSITLTVRDSASALRAELLQWQHGNGLVVLHLYDVISAAVAVQTRIEIKPVDEASSDIESNTERLPLAQRSDDADNEFRRALVALMLLLIDTWERSTGHNRIELAERSRIWRVHIDDGRLRARAMERYFSVSKLPQNPRWRDVLRSAYYVLAQCPLEAAVRDALQQHIDAVLAYTRRDAFV